MVRDSDWTDETIITFSNGYRIERHLRGTYAIWFPNRDYTKVKPSLETLLESGYLPKEIEDTILFNLEIFRKI